MSDEEWLARLKEDQIERKKELYKAMYETNTSGIAIYLMDRKIRWYDKYIRYKEYNSK